MDSCHCGCLGCGDESGQIISASAKEILATISGQISPASAKESSVSLASLFTLDDDQGIDSDELLCKGVMVTWILRLSLFTPDKKLLLTF